MAAAAYTAVWSLDPSEAAVEAVYLAVVATQVFAGLAAFVWAGRRALCGENQDGPLGIEQPTSDLDVVR